jgi:thioesterase domain-containing protein
VTTFGLVHGAWHGAWCWELLADRLRDRGHDVVTADLPSEDPTAGAEMYAQTMIEALADAGPDIVLAGHSLGALTVPVVAERLAAMDRPVRRMVLIAPVLPRPGRSVDSMRAEEPDRYMPGLGAGQIRHEDGSTTWQPQAAIATMYPDAPPPLAEWAANRLRRQHFLITREITPLGTWPSAEVTIIACGSDSVVNPDWVRRVARVRFGVEAHVLPGDHSPFLTRPSQLADILLATRPTAARAH